MSPPQMPVLQPARPGAGRAYRFARRLASRPHAQVRWALIVVIGLVATVLLLLQRGAAPPYTAYDRMVSQRLWGPAPDPRIILVDIDEASLDRLGREYGRWPWPRETLASVLAWLEARQAAAVVFDILFSDADPLNAASDLAFAEAVARSRRSYFPVLRLNPVNDGLSQVRADQLPGFAEPLGGGAAPTLALVPPVFEAVVATGRLGYFNIQPSPDGINRHYDLWMDKDGWRLWSLPARLARDMGWPLPEQPRHLIRYNQSPRAYLTIPFHEVWRLSQSRQGQQADARIAGAVVLIGSTASALFDLKATPVSPVHPGVHVLANVIDNVKNDGFVAEVGWPTRLLVTWLALAAMGWASARMREQVLHLSVLVIPGAMLALSFASLHVGSIFIDLSGPASQALTFFSLMSVYQRLRVTHFANLHASALLASASAADGGGGLARACLILQYPAGGVAVQRLLDAVSRCSGTAAVVQLLWSGERVDLQSSPAIVQLCGRSSAEIESVAQSLAKLEQGHAAFSHLCAPDPVPRGDAPGYTADQVWARVGTALRAWSEARPG